MSESHPTSATIDAQHGLKSPSYLGLLATQFLGAWNDNMFRWLLVPIGKDLAASQGATSEQAAALTLSVGLACFVLPYVLFAAPAGYLADKLSKRRVIVACKAAEVVIMILGVLSIWLGNIYALFTVLFFMGTQSALFGPAKLGSLPELVHPEKLSAANGLMNMVTMLAVVGGAGCGGVIYQFTSGSQATRLWVSAGALIGVAVAGWQIPLEFVQQHLGRPAFDVRRTTFAAGGVGKCVFLVVGFAKSVEH